MESRTEDIYSTAVCLAMAGWRVLVQPQDMAYVHLNSYTVI